MCGMPSFPLLYVSALYHFDYNDFVMQFEMTVLYSLLPVVQDYFIYLGYLVVPCKTENDFSSSMGKNAIDRECGYFGTFLLI